MDDSIKIIENGYVFTGDVHNHAGKYNVLIRNDRVVDIGKPAKVLRSLYPNAEIIDASGKVLLPGFVDAHYTGESFILRYLTAGYPMSQWNKNPVISDVFDYLQKEAGHEELLNLYRLSYYSAIKSGVTTLAEYGLNNPEHSFPATVEALQQVNLKGFIGLHNNDQVEAAKKLPGDRLRFGYVIENEQKLTTYDLQSAIRLVHELEWPMILHLGQTRKACDLIKKQFHKSIVQLCDEYKIFEYPVHIIHLACFDENDFEIIAKSGASLVVSPLAILRKETDMPPFEELLKHKIPIALGTDWGIAQPLENLRLYSSILKQQGLSMRSEYDLLALHTMNSARLLGLDKEIGSLEVGKKADIVFLDLSEFRMKPVFKSENPEKILNIILQESSSYQVVDVMINGDFYVRGRSLCMTSEDELAKEAQALLIKFMQIKEMTTSETSRTSTVIPFVVPNKDKKIILTSDIQSEEGFKVVQKESISSDPEEKSDPSSNLKNELPKNVRKIFGDDDV